MKIIFQRDAIRSSLRQGQWLFGAAGVLLLGYCGFVQADSWIFQNRERLQLEQLLHDRQSAAGRPVSTASLTPARDRVPAPADGLIGRIDIPRVGISVIVMEGSGRTALRRAVGHITGTALPGQLGNVGISGHRDTFFRPLRNIEPNDIITVTTLTGEYRYRVVSTKIVNPRDVAVLAADGSEILTLVTCYPFYYVGAAPSRFIVRAERVI